MSIPPSPSLSISSTRHSCGMRRGRGMCVSRPLRALPSAPLRRDRLDAADQLRGFVLRFGPVPAIAASLDRIAPTGAMSSIASRINASADHNSCRLAVRQQARAAPARFRPGGASAPEPDPHAMMRSYIRAAATKEAFTSGALWRGKDTI